MSLWSRIANTFRGNQLDRDIEEELQSHIDEAIAGGRDPQEAARAFGHMLQTREASRDLRIAARLDSLRADTIFGWRQLLKHRTASAAAILSLALAIGACTAAFRLIDAMLLRPMPVKDPGRLYCLVYQYTDNAGKSETGDSFEYPLFRVLRSAVKGQAELMAISYSSRISLTFTSDLEMEPAYRQYVSGWTFGVFGLKPAVGRLLTTADDFKPGAHPYAVLSYDYWTRRFGRDPAVIGRKFRTGNDLVEIVGVAERGFTGTETGTLTDIFVPTMMNAEAIGNPNWGWFRTWVEVMPGTSVEQVRQKLRTSMLTYRQDKVRTWPPGAPRKNIAEFVTAPVGLEPAAAGFSGLQKTYRRSLAILGVLVGLVLLIACANVANLLSAQAASRSREMALRVSLGAGRYRLVQLVLVESALLALLSSAVGGMIASWAAPFVVNMINPPDDPARLVLPADWRVLGFAAALALVVTILFGIVPALRASSVKPASALKGGEDPHSRRRLMNTLVAAQVAFCLLVHFVAGLFVSTFNRLSNQPAGFSSERLLLLEAVTKVPQSPVHWYQVTEHLRSAVGIEAAALCGWPLMSGNGWSDIIWANGHSPDDGVESYFLGVSPGWLDVMKIPLIDGRDFRAGDVYPKAAIVNEEFAKRYFDGRSPVGKSFEKFENRDHRVRIEIVGFVRDARYRNLREPIRPTIYVPFRSMDNGGALRADDWGTFVVRTAGADPLALASFLRREVPKALPAFRVANIHTQAELVRAQTIRERMLATLSLFFAAVALLLAGIGLYGVLDYAVLQRRREIGIRMALGAKANDIVRRVIAEIFGMLALGAAAGLAMGIASERYVANLLYQVKTTDLTILTLPVVTIVVAAALAALQPIFRAIRIDPSATLRSE